MSETETSGLTTTTEALTLTIPSHAAPGEPLAVCMTTDVAGSPSAPLSTPVSSCGPTEPAMPDVASTPGVQVTSADDL